MSTMQSWEKNDFGEVWKEWRNTKMENQKEHLGYKSLFLW